MELNKIYCGDCLELMKQIDDNSVDILITDPPYALGSDVIIRPDGKPDYSKAVDFMNKWKQPDGHFWEEWFKQAFRILKFGGRVIMFGMDRQIMLNKYYAILSGFDEQQSLYWFTIQNFPKASDLSKNIVNVFAVDREKVGENNFGKTSIFQKNNIKVVSDITIPTSVLAKKYDGYKYSVSPLKQTNETIMIFQKPYKTGSCLHDTLAFENGDKECLCGAMNIEDNRIPTNYSDLYDLEKRKISKGKPNENSVIINNSNIDLKHGVIESGRFPAQTFIDNETAKILDKQSDIKVGKKSIMDGGFGAGKIISEWGYDDVGGVSKILHKCKYDKEDYDLYLYCPKVNKEERNRCLDGNDEIEIKRVATLSEPDKVGELDDVSERFRTRPSKNNHPTIKPIDLMTKILKLFKTPNKQIILDTFTGSGSILISAKHLGFDWLGFEISEEYVKIAKARMSQSTLLSLVEDDDNNGNS
jgi:site-specific DNA-methyltransferase (adenine-specific)